MVSGKLAIFCMIIALSSAWDGGECSDKCWDCTGPSDTQCTFCVDHASKNYESPARCVCDPGWYGVGCKHYDAQPYATVGGCDPKCMGGCMGPTSSDCVRCVEGAHLDQFGACQCDAFFGGIACNMPVDHSCDKRCYGGCSGHTNYDCVACVNNAYRSVYGACLCKAHYSGLGCEDYFEYSECHPICGDLGCAGPGADDCVECVTNAHTNIHGCCECDNFWYGADCSTWMGTCDDKCNNGCTGPTASDCECCVPNATEDLSGACICNDGFGGEGCSLWLGDCDPICYGCHGPLHTDCDYCVENATKDEYGTCHCDRQWQGVACDVFVYQGECDPICVGCNGPTAGDCLACNQHAFLDNFDICQCGAFWSGADCGTYAYTGHCHQLCETECFGPDAADCVTCVPHSHKDSNNTCVCDEYWSGDDCSLRLYLEACHPICDQRYGCRGPAAEDCVECNSYSERDFEGHCQCIDGYHGNDCNTFNAPCHPMCGRNMDALGYYVGNDCDGPTACDCYQCGDHSTADPDFDGCCKCDKFWSGPACETYEAPCHPICNGCIGRSACDCVECVEHAHLEDDTCVCDENWGGEDCSIWEGPCHPNCKQPDHCHGPENCDCDYCTDHAQFDERNYCVCMKYYAGEGCTEYTGVCHPVCETCHGPNAMDCETCVVNAEFGSTGKCSCSLNWDGLDCSEWVGDCDIRCNGCSSPNPCDCNECVSNAHFDQDGLCECDDYWSGYSCTEYQGFCDHRCIRCFGPSNKDCEGCVTNAHRNDDGACECDADWRDEDCSVYAGQCHPKCESGCFGPTDADCQECICHSHRNENHICVCNPDWTGPDCSQYMGYCDDACDGCNGPPVNTEYPKDVGICEQCVDNAHRDENGNCQCNSDWSTASDCHLYSGPCWKNCAQPTGDSDPRGCYGPTEYDCYACIEHSHRSVDGYCACDADWGDSATGACDSYTGVCDHRCSACHGPTNADCEACTTHASGTPCTCDEGWGGKFCQYYNAKCDSHCDGCTGPTAGDCVRCVPNAERNSDGDCICQPGIWAMSLDDDCDQCTRFIDCDPICSYGDEDLDFARTCDGPGRGHCYECVTNAHRNWEGQCECDDGWTGPDCSDYDGECDCKCDYSCHGPTAHDCNSCVANAVRDNDADYGLDQECVCDQWWTGDDCSIYRGPCASTCHGCSGPNADECEDCVANAYYEADGTCRCRDEWMGSDCTQKRADCHETCEICLTPNLNECIVCKDGFTLINGYCVPCADCCATCEPANGTAANQCLSCHPGFGLDGNGQCKACHPACATCSNAWEADSCLSCAADSTMGTSGHCLCDFPKVRVVSSQTCENYCPSGTVLDVVTRTCQDDPALADASLVTTQVYFHMENKLPLFNEIPTSSTYETVNSVYAESCNPPLALGNNRGSYFNGQDAQVNLYNFQASQSHSIELWAKTELGGASLAVTDAHFFSGWEHYDPPCDCQPHNEPGTFCGRLDFWISDCFTPVLTVHNFDDVSMIDMTDSHFRIDRGWTKVGYSISGTSDGSHVSIYHDDSAIHSGFLDSTIYKAIDDGFQTTIGSFHGAAYFFQGFLFDFRYSAAAQLEGEGLFASENPAGLINCDWNQYLDHEGECEECDGTCTRGCTSGDVCFECHPTCRTCTGHAVDECVDCWCGAEIDGDGCCMCDGDAGFEASGDKCQQTACFSEGCDACDKGQCIHCEYGYDLHDGACSACREQDCTDLSKKHLPLCEEKGVRHDTGFCNCDSGRNVDDNECRVCSMGCESCTILDNGRPQCNSCYQGYIAIDDMPHLCAFLQDDSAKNIPIGYSLSAGTLYNNAERQELFIFDLTKSADSLATTGYSNCWSGDGRGAVCWDVSLRDGKDRRDSVHHATRGMWFDGKYDYLIMDGALPPRMNISFWTKPSHDGTLFSVSAINDEANQHLLYAGIRGNRLDSSVQYGDDKYHSDRKNKLRSNGHGGYQNSGFVTPGSVHENSPFVPNLRYSKTDMDVIQVETWANVGYTFDYNYGYNQYMFRYQVNGLEVDTSFYAALTNIYHDLGYYDSQVLFGAQEVDDALSAMYRGFIYEISANNGKGSSFFNDISATLGNCGWDWFFNGSACEHCPYWCREGCYDNGLCEVPTHNPWP